MKLSSIEAVVRALNDAHVPFLIVGGLAVVAHGYGRQTQDLDLVIQFSPDSGHAAFRALASLGYAPRIPGTAEGFADPAQRSAWIRDKGMTVLNFSSARHPETPIDVFADEPFDFTEEYAAAEPLHLGPRLAARVICLKTLLDMKRRAGRLQDLADIAELEHIHGP